MLNREWKYSAVGSDDFTIMQFNVLADGLAQTGNFKNVDSKDLEWEVRWPLIAKEIEAVDPDILCVQELNMPQDFSRLLSGHIMLLCPKLGSPAQDAGSLPDGCAMFLRKDRFHVLDAQVFYYGNLDPSKAKSAGGIVVGIKDKRNNQGVVFATTHLKAKPEFELIRNDQLTQLLQRTEGMAQMVSGYTNTQEIPIVLTGDFNSPPQESCYKLMRLKKYESAYNTLCSFTRSVEDMEIDEEEYAAGEPEFTTMKVREEMVKRTIDYIWVGTSNAIVPLPLLGTNEESEGEKKSAKPRSLLVQALYTLPSKDEIGPAGLPSKAYPSDHCSIAAKVAWNT